MYYRILRKQQGGTVYQTVDSVNLATTGYTDFNPPTGLTQYKVAAVMGSSCSPSKTNDVSFSNYTTESTIGLEENHTRLFTVYPNPASNELWIKSNTHSILKRIEWVDALGRVIWAQTDYTIDQAISLSQFPTGQYVIRVFLDNSIEYFKVEVIH